MYVYQLMYKKEKKGFVDCYGYGDLWDTISR